MGAFPPKVPGTFPEAMPPPAHYGLSSSDTHLSRHNVDFSPLVVGFMVAGCMTVVQPSGFLNFVKVLL